MADVKTARRIYVREKQLVRPSSRMDFNAQAAHVTYNIRGRIRAEVETGTGCPVAGTTVRIYYPIAKEDGV